MTQVRYVTDGPTGTWTGGNVPLTAAQVDENFYHTNKRIDDMTLAEPVSIDSFRFTNATTFYVDLTDLTSLGPYTLPTAYFVNRGAWAQNTAYAVNDLVRNGSTIYYVKKAHTSSSGSFDPAANDGLGNYYYSELLTAPSGPTGPQPPFSVSGMKMGVPTGSEKIHQTTFAYGVDFPSNFTGSYASAGTPATGTAAFAIYKNGSQVGALTFNAGATAGAFSTIGGAAVGMTAGDYMRVVGPSGADATLADISFSIIGAAV